MEVSLQLGGSGVCAGRWLMSVALHDTISIVAKSDNGAQHVGRFIRQQVIPAGMSVTEAARRLGVGRPALSSLLNGRAALSQNMALRLEATFGADRERLLELQAAGDRDRRSVEDRAVAVGTYAPSFLTIEARRIEEWAARIEARDRLPVLLRRLVHATGRELRRVDFPGYDNAQRHGWDGQVEADAATLWVPVGRSFWEFGVDQRPKAKADRDYRARVGALPPAERAKCTFVFVTPRNWAGKEEWERGRQAAGDWKAVRALDASDLEQWLENTIAPRIWLADELGIPTEGFQTLDRFWERWAQASEPPMSDAIFAPSVAVHADRFTTWLKKKPGDGLLTVAADSRREAVAFVACLFRHAETPAPARDHAVVFDSAGTLRALSGSPSPFIPIVYGDYTERELGSHYRQRHCIAVRPRNAVDRRPDIAVELLGHEPFRKALADMGFTEHVRIDRLASESGRSPTVLRRRLSPIPAISEPSWATAEPVARSLVPMALVGAWHAASKADCEVLKAIGRCDYNHVEKNIADLLRRDDSPVWCVEQYRGVVSKLDALFAVSAWMTSEDVANFLARAEHVLSESDPALELPDAQRWAAGLHGKVREHSEALRTGVCDSLAMLSVHGNHLFRARLGIDVAGQVETLVKRLLEPLTSDKLKLHVRDLPGYAEAAPEAFLALLEADMAQPNPALLELLKPTGASVLEQPWRTGVLWALERLAWNPRTFMRVVEILARLSQTSVDDGWGNNPLNSLSAIFCWWMPQTGAPLNDRLRAIETLCRRFPEIGWHICIRQFEAGQQVAFSSDRPRWRNDAAGAGQPPVSGERSQFARKALDLAIQWPTHDRTTLGDLLDRLGAMSNDDRLSVWQRIGEWSQSEADEEAKAAFREKVRIMFLTRGGAHRDLGADQRDRARAVCELLTPRDPVRRHLWLFAHAWLPYPVDDRNGEEVDFEEQERRIDELRKAAMTDVWSARGLDGPLGLLANGHPWTIGRYTAYCAGDTSAALGVLRACLSVETIPDEKMDDFMGGFLSFVEEDLRSVLVSTVGEAGNVEQILRVFRWAPFRDQTWRLLDGQPEHIRERYWQVVTPKVARFTESETTELVDNLLRVGRPREAYSAVQHDWDRVETSRLKRVLWTVSEKGVEFGDDGEIYRLSEAFRSLGGRPQVTVVEMARLEFAFIHALDRIKQGIPNIERRIAESPVVFVEALAFLSKRDDDGQDPPEWRVEDPERRDALSAAAYRLLKNVGRMPGADADGRVDAEVLGQWVREVRRLCREHGRAGIGDSRIGEFLSRAPSDEDGSWPCRAVCEVLEAVASEDIGEGFEIGVYNARGVVSRGADDGGVQERELAARYRGWAGQRAFDYPYVARILEDVARLYDRGGEREDSEVVVRRRLWG